MEYGDIVVMSTASLIDQMLNLGEFKMRQNAMRTLQNLLRILGRSSSEGTRAEALIDMVTQNHNCGIDKNT